MIVNLDNFSPKTKSGFLVLDGVNGAGKTTIQKKIIEYLNNKSISCIETREPGATKLGKSIRELVVEAKVGKPSPWTEVFLFAADRAEHVQTFIKPNLAKNVVVICDRYYYSTLAFQGYGRKMDLAKIRTINEIAIDGVRPDLAIIFDLPAKLGLQRTSLRNSNEIDSFESEELEFHENLRKGFLQLANDLPEACAIIDASLSPDEVWTEVKDYLDIWIGAR
jgi:dTMP kinase